MTAGYAWYYRQYAADVPVENRAAYERAEAEARSAKRGLWEQPNPLLRLMNAIDYLNDRYGRDTVRCGLFSSSGAWKTRFDHRPPNYTTSWADLMVVH
jgi:Domain of unknown function (DUF4113)/Staphylococcal nuclease homologue